MMTDLKYSVKQAGWTEHKEAIQLIRIEVFIVEQHVPETLEWDGLDDSCIHVLAVSDQQKPLGTARLLHSGQICRMAVLKEARHRGIGTSMLHTLLNIARKLPLDSVFLNAQLQALNFYINHGFRAVGPVFNEAGILHRKMVHKLK